MHSGTLLRNVHWRFRFRTVVFSAWAFSVIPTFAQRYFAAQCSLTISYFIHSYSTSIPSTRIQFQLFQLVFNFNSSFDSYTVYWLLSLNCSHISLIRASHYFLPSVYQLCSQHNGEAVNAHLHFSLIQLRHPRGDTDSKAVAYLTSGFPCSTFLVRAHSLLTFVESLCWSNDVMLLIPKCLGFWLAISGHVVLSSSFSHARCMQQYLIWLQLSWLWYSGTGLCMQQRLIWSRPSLLWYCRTGISFSFFCRLLFIFLRCWRTSSSAGY